MCIRFRVGADPPYLLIRMLKKSPLRISSPHYHTLLATYLRPLWLRMLVMAALLLGSIGLQLLYPQVLQRFIDRLVSGAPVDELYRLGLLFLASALSFAVHRSRRTARILLLGSLLYLPLLLSILVATAGS